MMLTNKKQGGITVKKLFCCLLVILMSCSIFLSAVAANPVIVEGITLDKESVIIPIGKSAVLKATIAPKNATAKKLEWLSSDESIATVKNGKITAVSCGTATITAKATDGSDVSTNAQVTVVTPVKKVTFSEKKLTIAPGTTWQLSAEVMPEDASIKDLTWKSSNEKVIMVDEKGLITGIGKGSANITAAAADGSGAKATISVKVQNFNLVFTSKEPQIVNYYYGSGSFTIKGSVKTGNVSIPEINTSMMVMMVGGPAREDVSVTPVKPGTDVVTIKVGRKKYKYTVYVSPEAFEEEKITESEDNPSDNPEGESD